MKNKHINAPFEMLIAIVERGKSNKVSEILTAHDCNYTLTTIGEGTAQSEVSDIFGFGIVERDVVWALVNPIMSQKILDALDKTLELKQPSRGIAMCIPINAATNLMLDSLGINY
ncbi:MAG: hypothetical protein E7361_01670 [Clostridiales bacterium]|nr:hypothetical protein [Clostridiales bacterium]